jgi:phospholipase/lecithinase/hemolysin
MALIQGALLVVTLVACCGVLMSVSAKINPAFDHMVVFGDSLSDTGNAGRFSNGPVWVEQLAASLNVALQPSLMGGTNFAIGGAKLDAHSDASSLRAQADLYLRKGTPSGRTLHVVFGGGNDVLGAIGDPEASRAIGRAAESLRSIVADLLAHGATDLLIPNVPDVSITPDVRARGSRAAVDAARLSQLFNEAAERALDQVAPAFRPARKLYRLDVHAMAERASKDPGAFGFVDVSTPCNVLPTCDGHLFWDGVHPTTQAHARLGDAALQVLFQQ